MAATTPTVNQRVNEIKKESTDLAESVKEMVSKAMEKAMDAMRQSLAEWVKESQTTATKEEVHEVDAVREMGYAEKVFDGGPERNLEVREMGYAEKVFDGSSERVLQEGHFWMAANAWIDLATATGAQLEATTKLGICPAVGTAARTTLVVESTADGLTATGNGINCIDVSKFISTFDPGGCEIDVILATFLIGERGKKVPELSQLNAKPAHHGLKTAREILEVFIFRNISNKERIFSEYIQLAQFFGDAMLPVGVNKRDGDVYVDDLGKNKCQDTEDQMSVQLNGNEDRKFVLVNANEDRRFVMLNGNNGSENDKQMGDAETHDLAFDNQGNEDICNRKRKRDCNLELLNWVTKVARDPCNPVIGCLPDYNSDLEDKVVFEGRSNVMNRPISAGPSTQYNQSKTGPVVERPSSRRHIYIIKGTRKRGISKN